VYLGFSLGLGELLRQIAEVHTDVDPWSRRRTWWWRRRTWW